MANITNVNELWGRKWRFKDDTPSPSEFSLRNSVTGVKFATFYLGEEVKEVYQTGSNVGNVGITTQGTFIRIGVSESSFTYAYAANGWIGKPAILEFIENTNNYTLSCTNESNFITWFNENATEYVPPLDEWAEGVANKVRKLTGKTDKFKLLDLAKELDNVSTGIDTSDATATPNDMLLGKTAYVDGKKIEGTIETWNGETNSDVNVENVVSVNGLIEEYKVFAGENISAGDFVDFISNTYKQLVSSNYSCYQNPSCCLLSNSQVFIAHSYSSSRYLYGTIVNIDGTAITYKTTQLNSTAKSYYTGASCVLIDTNKVFIAHSVVYVLYGTIVEINGTEMTATSTQLNSESNSSYSTAPNCILLEPNKVFIAHTYNSDNYLYGTIVEINGNEMTATSMEIGGAQSSRGMNSCVLLEHNKVFISHILWNTGTYRLYGTIVEINGTTMTAVNSTQLFYKGIYCFCILLELNKVFIAHADESSYYLYGTIVEINGTEMIATTTKLNNSSSSCYTVPSCVLLKSNKVFIAHSYSSNYRLYGTTVMINGTEMTATSTQLNSTSNSCYEKIPSCCLLYNGNVFIAHSYSNGYRLYGTIYFGNQAKQPTSNTFKGIAKTSGTGGETIQVFVPNTGV